MGAGSRGLGRKFRGRAMALAAGASAVAFMAAGCGGTPEPTETVGTPPPSSSSASPTTASASASASEGSVQVPAAARKHTKEGALAFIDYYFKELNKAYQSPTSDAVALIRSMSVATCNWCSGNLEGLDSMVKEKNHSDISFRLDSVKVTSVRSDGGYETVANYESPAGRVFNSKKKVVDQAPREADAVAIILRWNDSWAIEEVDSGR